MTFRPEASSGREKGYIWGIQSRGIAEAFIQGFIPS